MTDFDDIAREMAAAVNAGDGDRLAALFRPDGVYVDGWYGAYRGRQSIKDMLESHFLGAAEKLDWQILQALGNGTSGFTRWRFSYVSTLPEASGRKVILDGFGYFTLKEGLIEGYEELFDRGLGLVQLGMEPTRIHRVLSKAADRLPHDAVGSS